MRACKLSFLVASLHVICSVSASAADALPERLTGTVYAADGSPAGGAIVWAAKFNHSPLVRCETIADETGKFALNLDAGEWYIWGRRGTQGGEGPARHESVKIAPGRAPEPVEFRLEERGTFRGRLLEAESGRPIPGGQLYVDAGLVLTADADGRLEVGGLYRGNHESFVVAPGRMRIRVLFDTTARENTELEVAVPRGVKIVGRVSDMDGKPIPGAHVGRHTSGSYFSINGLFQACEANGRYEYDDAAPADQPTRLAAAAPGYIEVERVGLVVPSDGTPLEVNFRLRPQPSDRPDTQAPGDERRRVVSGTVRGPDDQPRSGVVVRWGYQPLAGAIQTRTDEAGRFNFTVPNKDEIVAVLPDDCVPEFPRVAAGGDQTIYVKLQAGQTARGVVRDDTGHPIKNAKVISVVQSPDPRIGNQYWLSESAVRTGDDGRFLLKGIPNGARFDFLKAGLSEVRGRSLTLGDFENEVTMLYGGALSGRVVDSDGKPIPNFRVIIGFPRDRRPGDKVAGYFAGYSGIGVRFTSPDGSFVFTGVGAESVYRVQALADGYGEAVADRMTAVPTNRLKDTVPVTLQAGLPLSLRVHALTADHKPIADARVTLVNGVPGLDQSFSWGYHDASWENMVRTRTSADGWADFRNLSFSGATVLIRAPGHARQRLGWRKDERELTIELAPEAVVAGDVRDADGKPVKEFYVNLRSAGDQISASVGPDENGRFHLDELPARLWTISVRGGDGVSKLYEEEVALKAGESKEFRIDAKSN